MSSLALLEAAVWPLAGHAQQSERMRRLGVLISWSERDPGIQAFVTAFVQALERLGLVEGKNIQIDQRSPAGDAALFKSYAAELVGLSPDVIFATSAPSVAALQHQTRTIPIVLAFVPDPVGLGFVQSLAQPGGNIAGFSGFDPALMGKWLQLLKGIAARITQVSVIFNPETTPYAPLLNRSIEDAAPSSRVAVSLIPVRDDTAIEEAISNLAREPGGGLIALPDSFNVAHRDVIIAAAIRHRLPAMGLGPLFSRGGGLMSYAEDPVDEFVRAAS